MLRNATCTLSNFCRGKPQPSFGKTRPALPALQLLIHSDDKEVFADACWALSYLSDGTNDKIQAFIGSGSAPGLSYYSLLIPALRVVGNIVTGNDMQTQGCIRPLCDLLVCPDARMVTVCLEGLENILKVGEAEKNLGSIDGVNHYAQMIDDAEGLEKVENLQS